MYRIIVTEEGWPMYPAVWDVFGIVSDAFVSVRIAVIVFVTRAPRHFCVSSPRRNLDALTEQVS